MFYKLKKQCGYAQFCELIEIIYNYSYKFVDIIIQIIQICF